MCGIISVIDRSGETMDGTKIKHALSLMNERGSGEGAGYAAYGVYAEFADYYALHVFFDNPVETKCHLDALLETWGTIVHDEEIPTYEQSNIRKIHTPWRYFFKPDRALKPGSRWPEEDIVTSIVMKVNTSYEGILIFSSGKNIGVFKAAGWPEEVADFYRIENYEGHIWEVDVFMKENNGLVLAEIELGSEDEHFAIPPWIGEEVTGDMRYYNVNLLENPYNIW